MNILLVVANPKNWPLNIPGVNVVSARSYLTDPTYSEDRSAKVFNLCRTYSYQSSGYYVSLLAAARGHKPLPDINTLQDLKSQHVIRVLSEDMEHQIDSILKPLQSKKFTLSIYFGRNTAKRYNSLCLRLFNSFRAPLLRATFIKNKTWQLDSIRTIAVSDIPEIHRNFVISAATEYFSGRKRHFRKRTAPRYDIAVLHNPDEAHPPSNEKALKKFQKAAEATGLDFELIARNDLHRLAEFDALFIRETTAVNHHTFRFAQRAAAEGLVVIDDPDSILKCTNKVYLAELLARNNVPIPKTLIIHKNNINKIEEILGLPCILKQPDSAFSAGVMKVENETELEQTVSKLLTNSDLIVAQEFLPTDFDWRIGICDRRPLYACRYHMASKHWQIIKRDDSGKTSDEGKVDTMSIGEAPDEVIKIALKAANLIGDGLYGVDVKQVGNKCYIIEVNDNPSIDAGFEDGVMKDALYREIMGVFLKRIELRKRGNN
ncbi:MAG: glutathione synthase/RimK-type ligase-like ATP-grasp enzyme [Gammaproteobacteria bacterium]|jgi:glutathione synthase/RimK-type ligase-like ATP-grasp enzyme